MSTTASSGERTDEELFLAYVDGDRAAFAELFERYGPLVGRLVRRRVFDRDAAQDLVQQTFFQLHRARADFRRDGKLRPWVAAGCFIFGLATALPVAALAWVMRRASGPEPRRDVLMAGVAGATGLMALQLHCPITQTVHLLAAHVMVVLAALALVTGVYRRA